MGFDRPYVRKPVLRNTFVASSYEELDKLVNSFRASHVCVAETTFYDNMTGWVSVVFFEA